MRVRRSLLILVASGALLTSCAPEPALHRPGTDATSCPAAETLKHFAAIEIVSGQTGTGSATAPPLSAHPQVMECEYRSRDDGVSIKALVLTSDSERSAADRFSVWVQDIAEKVDEAAAPIADQAFPGQLVYRQMSHLDHDGAFVLLVALDSTEQHAVWMDAAITQQFLPADVDLREDLLGLARSLVEAAETR